MRTEAALRIVLSGCVAGAVLLLAGCTSMQARARQDAHERWNTARADIKARLAEDHFDAGNVDAASNELAEALRLNPTNDHLVPLRVRVLLAEGRLDEAARLIELSRSTGHSSPEIEYLLGVVRQQQERWQAALEAYLRAAELSPHEVGYVTAAAQVWLQLGEPEAALTYLNESETRFAWTDAYQACLAECLEQVGDWSGAASAWQRVLYADATDQATRERLANALYHSERYLEAIPVLLDWLATADSRTAPVVRLLLADCYLAEGRIAAAQEQARTVVRNDEQNVHALCVLARALGAGGEYSAALRIARRALALDPANVATLELVAALAWRVDDYDLMATTAQRLEQVDPGNDVARRIAGRARLHSTDKH